MELEELKKKLMFYKKEDLIITDHAILRADFRETNIDEVKNNILNPEKLVKIKEKKSKFSDERKFECYFKYSDILYHKYVLTVNRKIIIVTIIIINRRLNNEKF